MAEPSAPSPAPARRPPPSFVIAAVLVAVQLALLAAGRTRVFGALDTFALALLAHPLICIALGRAAAVRGRSWVYHGVLPALFLFVGPWVALLSLLIGLFRAPRASTSRTSVARQWLVLAGIVLLTAVAYVGWRRWDSSRVESFCVSLRPGTPVAALGIVAAQFDVSARWVKPWYVEKEQRWMPMFVPITATLGDCGCRIAYDDKVVQRAEMVCR